MDGVEVGRVVITLEATEDGDLLTDIDAGDLPLVTVLGLLAMSSDSLLHPAREDDQ